MNVGDAQLRDMVDAGSDPIRAGGAGFGPGGVDRGLHRRLVHLRRQVGLDHAQLVALDLRQVVAARRVVLGDRILALLDHLLEHGQHRGVVELDALVDLALLDGGQHQPNHAELGLVSRLHGGLHVILDA